MTIALLSKAERVPNILESTELYFLASIGSSRPVLFELSYRSKNVWWPKPIDTRRLSSKLEKIPNLNITWVLTKGRMLIFDEGALLFSIQGSNFHLWWRQSKKNWILSGYGESGHISDCTISSSIVVRKESVEERFFKRCFFIKRTIRKPLWIKTIMYIYNNLSRMAIG